MNLVFYGRYSDSGQPEQSIEGQRKVCYEFAERNGYRIIGEYIDRAISGTGAENRPEFLRMIADSATYKAKLKKNGVKVLSARENITDDASGVLMESVLEGMAENTMADIVRYPNENGVKTSQGNSYNKSSIHRILINRKYLGTYTATWKSPAVFLK